MSELVDTVTDRPEESRFVYDASDGTGELVYRARPGRLVLVHTGVPSEHEGHGIGSKLVRAAVARAAANHETVVPLCPYARRWLQTHPDEAAAVDIDWSAGQ